jgi:acetyl-CoA carboxylase carboxyl transferase subunit alpha
LGSAHKDVTQVVESLGKAIFDELEKLKKIDMDKLIKRRYERLMSYGVFQDAES